MIVDTQLLDRVQSTDLAEKGLDPELWTRDLWLCGHRQVSGGCGVLVGDGAEVVAVGVSAAGVVAGDPGEHGTAEGLVDT